MLVIRMLFKTSALAAVCLTALAQMTPPAGMDPRVRQSTGTPRRMPVMDTINDLHPGLTFSVSYSCQGTAANCLNLALPNAVGILSHRGGPFAHVNFTPEINSNTKLLTIRIDRPMEAGDWLAIIYGDRQEAWAPVLPRAGSLDCGFPLNAANWKVSDWSSILCTAEPAPGLDYTLLVTTKSGAQQLVRFSEATHLNNQWKFTFPGLSGDVLKGAQAEVFVDLNGEKKSLGSVKLADISGTDPAPGVPVLITSAPPAQSSGSLRIDIPPTAAAPPASIAPAAATHSPGLSPKPAQSLANSIVSVVDTLLKPISGTTFTYSIDGCRHLHQSEDCRRLSVPSKACLSSDPTATDCSTAEGQDLLFIGRPAFDGNKAHVAINGTRQLEALRWLIIEYGTPVHSAKAFILPAPDDVRCCQQTVSGEISATLNIPHADTILVTATNSDGESTWTMNRSGVRPDLWKSGIIRPKPGTNVTLSTVADGAPHILSSWTTPPEPLAAPPPPPRQPPAIVACPPPSISGTPTEGGSTVTVSSGCQPNDPAQQLRLYRDETVDSEVIWIPSSVAPPYLFSAKLKTRLKGGEAIRATLEGADPASAAVRVANPLRPPSRSDIQTVTEGSTSVIGYAPSLEKVRVALMNGTEPKTWQDASVDSASGIFTANFTNPLQADQRLEVYGMTKSGNLSEQSTTIQVGSYGIDWGRVRGYFTAGTILSNSNKNFNLTAANTFLGFNLDSMWPFYVTPQYNRPNFARLSFHTFLDIRLTAIPSATKVTTSASSMAAVRTDARFATTTANPDPNVTTLVSSSQSTSFQTGAYAPFTFGSWHYKDQSHSLYVGPLVKAGIYTVASDTSQNATSSTAAGRVFPFHAFGFRLGHHRDFTHQDGSLVRSRAPEQLSYIDATIGRWANFENLSSGDVLCGSGVSCSVRSRLYRYQFEGLLLIPNTPLVVGFNANVTLQRYHPTTGAAVLYAPDDLRFLFGVRFDASKLTGILGRLGAN